MHTLARESKMKKPVYLSHTQSEAHSGGKAAEWKQLGSEKDWIERKCGKILNRGFLQLILPKVRKI